MEKEKKKPTFIIPDGSKNNKITPTDINKGELRITVAFKTYFTANKICIHINNLEHARYVNRINRSETLKKRSDILKLGKDVINLLELEAGSSLNFYQISDNNFLVEKA